MMSMIHFGRQLLTFFVSRPSLAILSVLASGGILYVRGIGESGSAVHHTVSRGDLFRDSRGVQLDLKSYDLGRALLVGREPGEAFRLFSSIWESQRKHNEVSLSAPRGCLAFYLGLCAEAQAENSLAQQWYARAERMANEENNQPEEGCFYSVIASHIQSHSDVASASFFSGVRSTDDRDEKAKLARLKLEEAEKSYEGLKGADPADRIKALILVMSWRFLHAELASDERLYSQANDDFVKAWGEMLDIERQLADPQNKAVWEKIKADPRIIARIDAVHVRLRAVTERDVKARVKETERLKQLRELARKYQNCAEDTAKIATAYMLNDYKAATVHTQDLHGRMSDLEKVVATSADYFLLSNEQDDKDARKVRVLPFTADMRSHAYVLKGMVAYREAVGHLSEPIAKEQLKDAIEAAMAAKTSDPGNAMATYLLGIANEASGISATTRSPADQAGHVTAKVAFNAAKESFRGIEDVVRKLSEKDPGASEILKDIQKRRLELEGPKVFMERAATFAKQGRFDLAALELRSGLERHRDPDLWLARAEMRLRSRVSSAAEVLEELGAAVKARVFSATDYRPLLMLGKAKLAEVQREIGKEVMEAPIRARLESEVASSRKDLENAIQLAMDGLERAHCEAYLTQAIAYHTILQLPTASPSATPGKTPQLVEVYNRAERADELLRDELQKARSDLSLMEALVAINLARGFLAVRIEGKNSYKDTALKAFQESVSVASRLPYAYQQWELLGAPLLAAIKSRPENAAERGAIVEQRLREIMTYFVEGVVALQQGQAKGATARLEQGLLSFAALNAKEPITEPGLEDKLQGYRILSQLESGEKEKAVVEILRFVVPSAIPPGEAREVLRNDLVDGVRRATQEVTSPILAYALGSALEQHVASFGLDPVATFGSDANRSRKELLASATASYRRCKDLLDKSKSTIQFQALAGLCDDAIRRLASDEFFRARAKTLISQYRLGEAETTLVEGIARHPESSVLWQSLLELRIDLVDIDSASQRSNYQELLGLTEKLRTLSTDRLGQRPYWEGYIYERLGRWKESVTAYESVIKNPNAMPENRVRAMARLAPVKLRAIDEAVGNR